jgi:tagatose 1,6-diphosphate aldolase
MANPLFKLLKRRPPEFFEAGPLVDQMLELIEPSPRWVDSFMRSVTHPMSLVDRDSRATRSQLMSFVHRHPRGRSRGEMSLGLPSVYEFWMRLSPRAKSEIEIAGRITLRIGHTDDLRLYVGHIGYNVFPAARGQHLAERSARLLLPLARKHGMTELWITTNPDNAASRRTCERLGAEYVDTVDLPSFHPLRQVGDTQKCRYRLDLLK